MGCRITLVGVMAALAVVGSAGPSAGAPVADGYRAVVIERLTSGAPGAHPNLGLLAHLDDGAGGAPLDTGQLDFVLDRRQLDDESVEGLLAAPAGTLFGWLTSNGTGGTAVQMPCRKTGVSDEVISAGCELPREFGSVVGSTAELTIHVLATKVVVSLNVQEIAARWWRANRQGLGLELVSIYFLGEYSAAGVTRHFAVNPVAETRVTLGLEAWPCADVECTRLGPAVTDAVSATLPQRVTVNAPTRAFYGRNVTFTGTAAPGDAVHLTWVRSPGGTPACTPTTAAAETACWPALAATYDRRREVALAGVDGRWSQSVSLKSHLFGPEGQPHPASGRYAAVAYSGATPWADPSFNGGTFSIFVPSNTATTVVLSKPAVVVRRLGSRLRVRATVAGGDVFVRATLKLDGKRVAAGQLSSAGEFSALVAAPRRDGVLRVTASVWGAEPSTTVTRVSVGP